VLVCDFHDDFAAFICHEPEVAVGTVDALRLFQNLIPKSRASKLASLGVVWLLLVLLHVVLSNASSVLHHLPNQLQTIILIFRDDVVVVIILGVVLAHDTVFNAELESKPTRQARPALEIFEHEERGSKEWIRNQTLVLFTDVRPPQQLDEVTC